MRGAGERGQWADRITHTLDVEAPGEYTGRPTPSAHRCGSVSRHRAWAPYAHVFKLYRVPGTAPVKNFTVFPLVVNS